MTKLQRESDFFHDISPQVISLINERFENTKEIRYKDAKNSLDVATEGDTDSEKLINEELSKWFPNDKIVAEETLSETSLINQGRVWIVDPICGSANFKNGIRFFSTNIALAHDGKLIASCVVDHCKQEYVWSTGNNELHINKQLIKPEKATKGVMIEVDLSALTGVPSERIDKNMKLISFLLHNKNYYLSSLCSSLSFLYVALGRIDAYVNGFSKVWDTAAANFLIEQAGGTVTQLDGRPWTFSSSNVLATFKKELHVELLNILNS